MAAIDPSQFRAIHKRFPQLTLTQSADAFMFSEGVSIAMIAELRGVSEDSVKESLAAVRKKMGVTTGHAMTAVIKLTAILEMWSSFEKLINMMSEVKDVINHVR